MGKRGSEAGRLSFDLLRDTFEYEYDRRATASLPNGDKLLGMQARSVRIGGGRMRGSFASKCFTKA